MRPELHGEHTDGWLPAELALWNSPASVSWVRSKYEWLNAPFLAEALDRSPRDALSSTHGTSELHTIFDVADRLPDVTPSVVVFHISRCGSTLIANCLRSLQGAVVLSEPQPVGALLAPGRWSFAQRLTRAERVRLLRALGRIYAALDGDPSRHAIVKLVSWGLLALDVVQEAWPSAYRVFVIRSPLEVAVSNLATPPEWLVKRQVPIRHDDGFGAPSLATLTLPLEDYLAEVLQRFLQAVQRGLESESMLVSYPNITVGHIARVAKAIGRSVDATRVEAELQRYSKADEPVQFVPDAAEKQLSASWKLMRIIEERCVPLSERIRLIAARTREG